MEKISDQEFAEYKRRKKSVAWLKAIAAYTLFIVIGLLVHDINTNTIQRVSQYYLSNIDNNTVGIVTKSRKTYPWAWGRNVHAFSYRFKVGDEEYTGKLINYQMPDRYGVDSVVRDYPVGKEVIVYFDSRNPNYSILIQDQLGLDYLFLLMLFLVLSPIILFLGYKFFYDW